MSIVVGVFPKFHRVCIVVRVFPNLIRVYVNLALFRTIMLQVQFCHVTHQHHDLHISAAILASYIEISVFILGVLPKYHSTCIVVGVFHNLIRVYVNSPLFRTIMVQVQFCYTTNQFSVLYTNAAILESYIEISVFIMAMLPKYYSICIVV